MIDQPADPVDRAFLGVERSVSGQRWVSRLDQAGQNRALAMSQHHGLPVPADVGDEFDAAGRAHQRAALGFLCQGQVVADLGHGELVPQVARTGLEDERLFFSTMARN